METLQALERARDGLCWQHPSLAACIERLKPEAVPGARVFAVDGRRIVFGIGLPVECFSPDHLKRTLLHMIAHCLLGHPWQKRRDAAMDVQAWLLAEEIAPETALSGGAQEFRRRLRNADSLS